MTVPARAGVATFTNLTVNLLGTGYDLVATLPMARQRGERPVLGRAQTSSSFRSSRCFPSRPACRASQSRLPSRSALP